MSLRLNWRLGAAYGFHFIKTRFVIHGLQVTSGHRTALWMTSRAKTRTTNDCWIANSVRWWIPEAQESLFVKTNIELDRHVKLDYGLYKS